MIAGISVLIDHDWIDLAGMPKLKYFTPRGGICTKVSLTSEPWGTQTVRLPDFVRIGKYAIGEGINHANCIPHVFGCQAGMIWKLKLGGLGELPDEIGEQASTAPGKN